MDIEIPRYCVSIEVFDNNKQELIVNEGCNVSHAVMVEYALEKAIETMKDYQE